MPHSPKQVVVNETAAVFNIDNISVDEAALKILKSDKFDLKFIKNWYKFFHIKVGGNCDTNEINWQINSNRGYGPIGFNEALITITFNEMVVAAVYELHQSNGLNAEHDPELIAICNKLLKKIIELSESKNSAIIV